MSVAPSDGVDLYYERAGAGPPVLLVMGLGMNATGWWRTIPVLARSFTVLSFDNRGVGRSGRPPGPYSMAQMADDAVAVLDAAGVEAAHVYGVSLGGMIAQEIALRRPERVLGLVLAATTPGGEHAVAPDRRDARVLPPARPDACRGGRMGVRPLQLRGPDATRRRPADRRGHRAAAALPDRAWPYVAQLAAALGHDAYERLGAVSHPTLVVHGAEDRMVHPDNARLLAERIPAAQLQLWEQTGHLFFTDEPGIDPAVSDFLRA